VGAVLASSVPIIRAMSASAGPARGRGVVVHDAEGQARFGHLEPAFGELGEGVVRAFVHEMPVDPQQRRAILAAVISCASQSLSKSVRAVIRPRLRAPG
jgi:hypothetical protein